MNPTINCRLIGLMIVVVLAATAVAFGVTALLVNIFQRKQEARNPFFRVVELDDRTTDPAVWGKNFPQQYDGYLRTVDMVRTRFGGSEAVPRTPLARDYDPKAKNGLAAFSRIDADTRFRTADPRLRTMWSGYAFSRDFREERGHAYMLEDQTLTGRQQASPQPGACLHCHASVYAPYKEAGDGDLIKGWEKLNTMPYAEARKLVTHPVACIDCHDPASMQLRVTRPGFLEGIRALKASQGVQDYDPNRDASRQEMRSFVCGQCHVEYYFKGKEKRLTYPWFKGLKGDQILAYYDEVGFKDWTHAESGAPALKAQHPEFEMWNQGIHARAGVACADCHMPYKREGALKISDHHVRSPLLPGAINNACQTCHKVPEDELRARAEGLQQTTFELRDVAMAALMELIGQIKAAREAGAGDAQLAAARDFQRKGQFLLDFIEAENSMGFHAPQEAARLLALSIDYTRKGQQALAGQAAPPTAATTQPADAPATIPQDQLIYDPTNGTTSDSRLYPIKN